MKSYTPWVMSSRGGNLLQKQRVYKRKKETDSKGSPLLLPVLFVFFIISLFLYVWTRVQVIQYGYEISSALKAKEEALVSYNERMLELATLCSAPQLERKARQKLGMAPPRKDQVVIIR